MVQHKKFVDPNIDFKTVLLKNVIKRVLNGFDNSVYLNP